MNQDLKSLLDNAEFIKITLWALCLAASCIYGVSVWIGKLAIKSLHEKFFRLEVEIQNVKNMTINSRDRLSSDLTKISDLLGSRASELEQMIGKLDGAQAVLNEKMISISNSASKLEKVSEELAVARAKIEMIETRLQDYGKAIVRDRKR